MSRKAGIRPGVMLYFREWRILERLADAERGKLVAALVRYAQDGTEPELSDDKLAIAFEFLRDSADRDNEAYRTKCEKYARNGAKGRAIASNGEQSLAIASNGERLLAKTNTNPNTKTNTKTNTNISRIDTTGAADDDGGDGDGLQEIAQEHAAVFDAASRAGFPSSASDLDKLNALIADYGAAWVLEAIRRATDAPAYARSWRYLSAILKSWRDAGGIDGAGRPKHDKPETGNIFARLYRGEYGG